MQLPPTSALQGEPGKAARLGAQESVAGLRRVQHEHAGNLRHAQRSPGAGGIDGEEQRG